MRLGLLTLLVLVGCSGSQPLKLELGRYYSNSLDESLTILSDTTVIHQFKFKGILHNDTLKMISQIDENDDVGSLKLFTISNDSKLIQIRYGLNNSAYNDKNCLYSYYNNEPCIIIDPDNKATYFVRVKD